jgi:phosphoribosylaminoimidazole-succinocarboxamide synthase
VTNVLTSTNLPGIERVASGKVRDVYKVGDDLLIVATDRISAFDCILPQGIPGKGRVLTQMSLFWFDLLRDSTPNHLISADVKAFPAALHAYRDQLEGRSMLVKRCRMAPIECVARGYVSGSGWKDYKQTGAICGIKLPAGLRESDRLPEAIFTPATKAETGHDENITVKRMREIIGEEATDTLESMTRAVYARGETISRDRGIIIADTKFEFGRDAGGRIILIDEVMTPDSSRFWAADVYKPDRPQPSFDKQPLRDYLDGERRAGRWNGEAPPPPLPASVVDATSKRYLEAYCRITGVELSV